MTVSRGQNYFCDSFARAQAFTTTPGENGWTIKDTSSAGTPTYLCATEDGGKAVLTCDNTSEAQIVTLFHNDVLSIDIDNVQWVRWIAKVSGIDAVTTLVFGLASAQNDTSDSVANHAWFRMEGSASTSAVVVETDDGTTDNNDVATGASLAATYKMFEINFTYGKSDIRFYIDGARVAASTTFAMAAYTGQLQPYVQLQKASGTGTPAFTAFQIEYLTNYAVGA